VADKGYHQADPLEACEQAGVESFVPEPLGASGKAPGGREVFPKQAFRYDADAEGVPSTGCRDAFPKVFTNGILP